MVNICQQSENVLGSINSSGQRVNQVSLGARVMKISCFLIQTNWSEYISTGGI